MPEFPIVDAHVHLYDPGAVAYPWMADVPILDEAHLPERFFASTGHVEVESLVFVEVNAASGEHAREAAFVRELVATEPRIGAMVVSLPLDRGEAVMPELEACAADPLTRGVRTLVELHEDEPGWALREPFVAMVGALARFDLSFDICLRHAQLPDAIELVRRCPDTRFVLDHLGKPPAKAGGIFPWADRIDELAAEPNVACKVSGLVTEADHERWTVEDLRPYVEHVIEAFGSDRVMFGGDWPVSRLACAYPDWVDALDRIVAGASDDERRRLYRDNARAFYRLGPG